MSHKPIINVDAEYESERTDNEVRLQNMVTHYVGTQFKEITDDIHLQLGVQGDWLSLLKDLIHVRMVTCPTTTHRTSTAVIEAFQRNLPGYLPDVTIHQRTKMDNGKAYLVTSFHHEEAGLYIEIDISRVGFQGFEMETYLTALCRMSATVLLMIDPETITVDTAKVESVFKCTCNKHKKEKENIH